ncbi:DUF1918 domain-containing protein [Halobacterium litoreum]|uniref:DUF1918 domain-containing protein n=1 Tax=Halobacterium litoreum TaxID=2039234 RepID=A0ABD5NCL2_9EURY|nr:DUF1918 domain-containing protein [Halobacterium litoreum]UHH14248.1 DUF1918 domain-containing protein [Halobacterium litoreum]
MQHEVALRRGENVRVARQDPEKAKLAVYGYDHHQHFGDDGVVTEIRETEDGTWYVVRFDDYGRDAVAYRAHELEVA